MTARFAIYLAPPEGSALEAFAKAWLGRDHVTGEAAQHLKTDLIPQERLREITKPPRHYGFHGTLKAPFALVAGRVYEELEASARQFAAAQMPFEMQLVPKSLHGFLALMTIRDEPRIGELAAACVKAFEPFRAPLTPADIERRRRAGLTPRQDAQMLAWGYPYIFDDFRFHMTLTARLDEPERSQILAALQSLIGGQAVFTVPVSGIAIYGQNNRDEPFCLRARLPFASV